MKTNQNNNIIEEAAKIIWQYNRWIQNINEFPAASDYIKKADLLKERYSTLLVNLLQKYETEKSSKAT